jgi:hypothetical protein
MASMLRPELLFIKCSRWSTSSASRVRCFVIERARKEPRQAKMMAVKEVDKYVGHR